VQTDTVQMLSEYDVWWKGTATKTKARRSGNRLRIGAAAFGTLLGLTPNYATKGKIKLGAQMFERIAGESPATVDLQDAAQRFGMKLTLEPALKSAKVLLSK
jgi:hypothetical protein